MSNLSILFADDDPLAPFFFKALLHKYMRQDWDVMCVTNGQEALDRLDQQSVDWMITDLNMPELGGLDLLKVLKERPYPPRVLMISAYGDWLERERALQLGAVAFLTKPLSGLELVYVLEGAPVSAPSDDRMGGEQGLRVQ